MKREEEERIISHLEEMFPKGSTAFTEVTKVSKSGMSRHIKIMRPYNDEVENLSWYVAKLLGWTYKDNTRSIFVRGCGMDMGFHVIYTLAQALYGDGYALKQRWL
jgi:hypothetical protein|tara:strand:- start:219 stop:533 length:315 start_codon:yes stop_codon:yes gene_type:complete